MMPQLMSTVISVRPAEIFHRAAGSRLAARIPSGSSGRGDRRLLGRRWPGWLGGPAGRLAAPIVARFPFSCRTARDRRRPAVTGESSLSLPFTECTGFSVFEHFLHAKDQKVRCQALQADRQGQVAAPFAGYPAYGQHQVLEAKTPVGQGQGPLTDPHASAPPLSASRSLIRLRPQS